MDIIVSKFTVLFEPPFWIGLYERVDKGRYSVCRVVFGAEPKDNEIYEFLLLNWKKLNLQNSVKIEKTVEKKINLKRMQRLIHKQVETKGIGTKAQQALKVQQEQSKEKQKLAYREKRELCKQQQFELRKEKRKEKHRGH